MTRNKKLKCLVILGLALIAICGAIFVFQAYNVNKRNNEIIERKSDTITVYKQILQPPVYISSYIPKRDTLIRTIKIPMEYQPTGTEQELRDKLTSLSNKYFALKTYRDSIHLKDSTGLSVGIVNINDEISENSISDRKVNYQLSFPEKITTITNTINIREKPRRKVLAGFEAEYIKETPIHSIGMGLIYQDRHNRLFRISTGTFLKTPTQYYQVGFYVPLSFRK